MPKNIKLRVVIIIPARYNSSRLQGKPLLDICGQSMISRTFERCCLALNKENVYVATDDKKIFNHCQKASINVIMTPVSCKTGTDRVYEASKKIKADIYINVQGDEPIISPDDIKTIIHASQSHPDRVINAMCPINEIDFNNPSIPKVVVRQDNRLLYMSRNGVPVTKSLSFVNGKRQVCIYALPKRSLIAFSKEKSKTPLENIEDIEILRFLEIGYDVHMVNVSKSSFSIDVEEDLEKVRNILNV
jgi:3-deoxy-manno-octulosonate cytidylyltransferase (CMP-KDO synthetase)